MLVMQVRMRDTYSGREKFVQNVGQVVRNTNVGGVLGSFCCEVNWLGCEEEPPERPIGDRLVGVGWMYT